VSVANERHTYAEYLALEAESEEKHEFLDGEIVAMSGGTPVIETFTRQDDGSWTYRRHGPGDAFALDPIDAKIAVDEVFADVEFE